MVEQLQKLQKEKEEYSRELCGDISLYKGNLMRRFSETNILPKYQDLPYHLPYIPLITLE